MTEAQLANRGLLVQFLTIATLIVNVAGTSELQTEWRVRERNEACFQTTSAVADTCDQCNAAFPESASLWRCCHDEGIQTWCTIAVQEETGGADDGSDQEAIDDEKRAKYFLGKRAKYFLGKRAGRFSYRKYIPKKGRREDNFELENPVATLYAKRAKYFLGK